MARSYRIGRLEEPVWDGEVQQSSTSTFASSERGQIQARDIYRDDHWLFKRLTRKVALLDWNLAYYALVVPYNSPKHV